MDGIRTLLAAVYGLLRRAEAVPAAASDDRPRRRERRRVALERLTSFQSGLESVALLWGATSSPSRLALVLGLRLLFALL